MTALVDKFRSGNRMLNGFKQNIKIPYKIKGKKIKIKTFNLAASIRFRCNN